MFRHQKATDVLWPGAHSFGRFDQRFSHFRRWTRPGRLDFPLGTHLLSNSRALNLPYTSLSSSDYISHLFNILVLYAHSLRKKIAKGKPLILNVIVATN